MSNKTDLELIPVKYDTRGNPTSYAVARAERSELEEMPDVPQALRRPPRTSATVSGSHRDRAIGFSIRTWQISIIVGITIWLIGKLMVNYPLLSLVAMCWLVGGFFVVWMIAFLLDLLLSPEGVDAIDTISFWRFMAREQRERHNRK